MKKILPALLLVMLFISCDKKEDDSLTKPDVLLPQINAQLNSFAQVSDFNNALKELSLTAAETDGGITVFAPRDYSILLSSGITTLRILYSEQQLKDHIVKGKLTINDLRNKTSIQALSGKTLNIGRKDNLVTINGIAIVEEAVLSGSSGIVHVMEKGIDIIYPEPAPEIVVSTLTEAEFKTGFNNILTQLDVFQKSVLIMDALLSNEIQPLQASQVGYNSYGDFNGFRFSASSASVDDVWNKGYRVIAAINNLLRAKSVNFTSKTELIAELKTVRAYAYLQLLAYYGNIAIAPEVIDINSPPPTNTNKQQVINYIYATLAEADVVLEPLGKSPAINTYAVKALIAKLALQEKNYEKVKDYTERIIDSKVYPLETKALVFETGSREIIWQLREITNSTLKSLLNNRTVFPLIRLSEIHLMNAEAKLRLGKSDFYAELTTVLLARQNLSGNINDNLLYELWLKEMNKEGISFKNMVRWGIATQRLTGFTNVRFNLLPIPQREVNLNLGLVQNPGYQN